MHAIIIYIYIYIYIHIYSYYVLNKYNNTIHLSTTHTPKDAHLDKHSPDVAVNSTAKNIQHNYMN